MRVLVALSFAIVAFNGSAADAQTAPSVTLAQGQSIALEAAPDGSLRVVDQSDNAAGLSGFEQSTADALSGSPEASGPNVAHVAGPPEAASQQIVPGRIQIRLIQMGGDALVLAIDNGLDQAFTYRATMWRGQQSAPTDVCLVVPHLHGYEQWPYTFDRIVLSDLRLQPWRDNDQVVCQ